MGQILLKGTGGTGGYYHKVLSYSPIAYWPLWEAGGGVAECLVDSNQDGAYTGVTLGQTGIGDGRTCPLFDGAQDHVSIYSAALNTVFDGQEGSFMLWAKVYNAGVWSDSTHRWLYAIGVDTNNQVYLQCPTAVNNLYARYRAGGTLESTTLTTSSTAWMQIIQTWSLTAHQYIVYLNASPKTPEVNLGTWVGNLVVEKCVLGDNGLIHTYPWHGWIAHAAVFDKVLTPAQVTDLAVV